MNTNGLNGTSCVEMPYPTVQVGNGDTAKIERKESIPSISVKSIPPNIEQTQEVIFDADADVEPMGSKAEIIKTIKALKAPGDLFEVRAQKRDEKGIWTGHYQIIDAERIADDVLEKDSREKFKAIWFSLNKIKPEKFAEHELKRCWKAIGKEDIARREWLLLDFDRKGEIREENPSASAGELLILEERAKAMRDFLEYRGWPRPVFALSGNGYHLLYRIDLPPESDLVASFLKSAAAFFATQIASKIDGGDICELDTTTWDSPRVCKLYGTVSRKGNPAKFSKIEDLPSLIEVVSERQLQDFVEEFAPKAPPLISRTDRTPPRLAAASSSDGNWDIKPGDDFIARGPSFDSMLTAAGWTRMRDVQEQEVYCRPGKDPSQGGSARVRDQGNGEVLYVFSDCAHPFEPNHAYSKFQVYTLLSHDGDLSAAAKHLFNIGYNGVKYGKAKDLESAVDLSFLDEAINPRIIGLQEVTVGDKVAIIFGGDIWREKIENAGFKVVSPADSEYLVEDIAAITMAMKSINPSAVAIQEMDELATPLDLAKSLQLAGLMPSIFDGTVDDLKRGRLYIDEMLAAALSAGKDHPIEALRCVEVNTGHQVNFFELLSAVKDGLTINRYLDSLKRDFGINKGPARDELNRLKKEAKKDELRGSWRETLSTRETESGLIVEDLECNVVTVLTESELFKDSLKYDAFALQSFWARDVEDKIKSGQMQDEDVISIQDLAIRKLGIKFKAGTIRGAYSAAARRREVHPVRDYLKSLSWDGTNRLTTLLPTYFGAEKTDINRVIGLRFAISAVARIMNPGCKVDYMLILEGAQGVGKSRSVRALFGDMWTKEGLGDITKKDAMIDLKGKWAIEIAELSPFKGRLSAEIKDFLSRQTDRHRPPYGRESIDQPRQCVFIGTTNEDQYLEDSTGNRRYWPVECSDVDVTGLARDRDQIWAEAFYLYSRGEQWHPTPQEADALKEPQESRFMADVWQTTIQRYLEDQRPLDLRSCNAGVLAELPTVEEILTRALEVEKGRMGRSETNRVCRICRKLGYEYKQFWYKKGDTEIKARGFYKKIDR